MKPDASRSYEDIAQRLKWHREQIEGLTQAEYASMIGAQRAAYSQWEAGIQRLSLNGALRLNRLFALSLDWLYLGDDANLPLSLHKAWRNFLRESGKS